MQKRKLHHFWLKIRPISYWYFLIATIIFATVFIFAYRQNNLQAIVQREKLLKVDKENGDVEGALRELRLFTYSHMNAGLAGGAGNIYPPIQLKYTYDRLVDAEKNRVVQAQKQVTEQANTYCAATVPGNGPGTNRVPCIQEYIQNHPIKEQIIPDSQYKFDFLAPIWSPDLAGWSLLATFTFGFLFLLRLTLEKWLRSNLNSHL